VFSVAVVVSLTRLGVPLFESMRSGAHSLSARQTLELRTAVPLYEMFFIHAISPDLITDLDDLYVKVLVHIYGDRAMTVHPFILTDVNPLHMLVQLNVIMMGSPVLGAEYIGWIRYLQALRATCAVVAFTCLGRALNRTALAASGPVRQGALILQIALLLDQVVELREGIPGAATGGARGRVFGEMRRHLIQYLSYYLHKLTKGLFPRASPLFECLKRTNQWSEIGETFWEIISGTLGSTPLRPPMLRGYADLSWENCGDEDGEALHELFTSLCMFDD